MSGWHTGTEEGAVERLLTEKAEAILYFIGHGVPRNQAIARVQSESAISALGFQKVIEKLEVLEQKGQTS